MLDIKLCGFPNTCVASYINHGGYTGRTGCGGATEERVVGIAGVVIVFAFADWLNVEWEGADPMVDVPIVAFILIIGDWLAVKCGCALAGIDVTNEGMGIALVLIAASWLIPSAADAFGAIGQLVGAKNRHICCDPIGKR